VAGVPLDCGYTHPHRVGTDDLAMGPFHEIPTADQLRTGQHQIPAETTCSIDRLAAGPI